MKASPTSPDVVGRIARLSPEQRARLREELVQRGVYRPPLGEHLAADGSDARLSFAQERIWFLANLQAQSSEFTIPAAFAVTGRLSLPALEHAVAELIDRHDALRSSFPQEKGRPIRRVLPRFDLTVTVIDLSLAPPGARRELLLDRLDEETFRPFDLAAGPLLRVTVVRLSAQEDAILFAIHHLAVDDRSLGILLDELSRLYASLTAGGPSALPHPTASYSAFVAWQRAWLNEQVIALDLAHWRERLAGAPALRLPTDRPHPEVRTAKAGIVHLSLDAELGARLFATSRGMRTTLFVTLGSAFALVLGQYAGQHDVLFGVPIANRTRPELKGCVGLLSNIVTLRIDLRGRPAFGAIVERFKSALTDALAHQDVPFERVVEELSPTRDLARNPLIQVSFDVLAAESGTLGLGGLEAIPIEPRRALTRFDLEVHFREVDGGLVGELRYYEEVFDRATVERLARHLRWLIARVASDPTLDTDALADLTPEERHLALTEWNHGHPTRFDAGIGAASCLSHDFFCQAERTPDRIAVAAGSEHVSYADLANRARCGASALRALGARRETAVAVFMDRTPDLMAAVLAVLRADAFYVALDPKYPSERLRHVLADARADIVLMDRASASRLDELLTPETRPERSPRIVVWGDMAPGRADAQDSDDDAAVGENVAYVVYTSGSTGLPKGVAIRHGSAAAFVRWSVATFGSEVLARTLAVTSLCFDLSTFEFFAPLAAGGTVLLEPDALALLDAPHRQPTLLNTVPSAARELLRYQALPPSILVVNLAGEPLSTELVEDLLGKTNVERVYDLYGPSEDTTYSTFTQRFREARAHVGRPLAGREAYVLGRDLRPAPVGALGELYLGGWGLARGYLFKPDLTAQRFVPHPFASDPGARLYRTGDLARYLPDGTLALAGRVDHQIKVRGFRIELGEVEATLARHPALREAVVVAHETNPGDVKLSAYVVAQGTQTSADEERLLADEQVDHWRSVYEHTYEPERADETVGWINSYTGLPLGATEMSEWLDRTIAAIQELRPRSILDVGCGTGLFLSRLASKSERYWATDIAANALASLERRTDKDRDLAHVRYFQRAAHEIDRVASRREFDTVLLNSVIQYFPSARYLLAVLERAVAAVADGGHIFVGDVRNWELSPSYHASVQLYRAPRQATAASVRKVARERMRDEEELLVSPAFFLALRDRLPRVARVTLRLKRGTYANELSRFRYDVVIRVGEPSPRQGEPLVLTWGSDVRGIDGLRELASGGPRPILVRNIRNARLVGELALTDILADAADATPVEEVRQAVAAAELEDGIDPEALWASAEGTGARVWCAPSARGSGFDLCVAPPGSEGDFDALLSELAPGTERDTSDPLSAVVRRRLLPELREFARAKLPEWMVPDFFVTLEKLPRTPGGKVDRARLPKVTPSEQEFSAFLPRTETEQALFEVWRAALGHERFGIEHNFFDVGGHSLLLVEVRHTIEKRFGRALTINDLFRLSSIRLLGEHLDAAGSGVAGPTTVANTGESRRATPTPAARHAAEPRTAPREDDIAVIGMALRFPGASTVEGFWDNISRGVESIARFSDRDLEAAGIPASLRDRPNYVRAFGVLDDIETFDAALFSMNPREAEVLDPQHRVFLECAWEALESAGCDPRSFGGPIGVFAGAGMNTYLLTHLYQARRLLDSLGEFQTLIASDKDFLATRVSYKMNLRGPSINVGTACSTSLVAIHLACRSLREGQCDVALAGGVSISTTSLWGYLHQPGTSLSPEGECRVFDARARGTVPGNGAGVVVLKRLADARRDGDDIRAIVKGSAINNDGSRKVGFTAPSVEGQSAVIAAALTDAGVHPDSIGYVEAHGTGTELGDPIEVAALVDAYRGYTDRRSFCALGAVKANVGHLNAAAGVAGFIKAVVALDAKKLPPAINCEATNPSIDFASSPFFVNRELVDWVRPAEPRRAAVSSFGVGGTNAHVILEEAPARPEAGPPNDWDLLVLSARTATALSSAIERLAAHLRAHPDARLSDVAHTLAVGRTALPHRCALVCRGVDDALRALATRDDTRVLVGGPDSVSIWLESAARQVGRLPDAASIAVEAREAMARRDRPGLLLDRLTVLAKLWLAGQPIDWNQLYLESRRRKVSLPTYPFERQRYWIEPEPDQDRVRNDARAPAGDASQWFYVPTWSRSDARDAAGEARKRSRWLIFADELGLADPLAQKLRAGGAEVVLVRHADRFDELGALSFAVRPADRADHERLSDELIRRGFVPDAIAHLGSVVTKTGARASGDLRKRGFASLVSLAQVLGVSPIAPDERRPRSVDLLVITTGAEQVFGGDHVDPDIALVRGPCVVIPQEYSNFSCRHIDLGSAGADGSLLLDELERDSDEPIVAYRDGERWVRRFERTKLESTAPSQALLRQRGVYLVTGGLGGIGAILAESLAARCRARLVLVGRGAGEVNGHTLREKLEALGAEVEIAQADVCRESDLRRVRERVHARFGPIHGIVHAAGVAPKGLMSAKTPEAMDAILAPKVEGTSTLERVFGPEPLDFFVLMSSTRAFTGGAGGVDYAAANAYLHAFAASRRHVNRVQAVAWGGWRGIGMNGPGADGAFGGELDDSLSSQQAVDAFYRALGSRRADLIVSREEFGEVIERWRRTYTVSTYLERTRESVTPVETPAHPRPVLATPYRAPRTALETTMAKLWQAKLGIDSIGVDDNFMELGGDSIASLQIVAELNQAGYVVRSDQFFEYPTIAELAAQVDAPGSLVPGRAAPVYRITPETELTPAPITAIQRWFLGQGRREPRHYGQYLRFDLGAGIIAAGLHAALHELVERHDGLRMRFYREGDDWMQFPAAAASFQMPCVDLSALSAADRERVLETSCEAQSRAADPERGRVFGAALLLRGTAQPRALALSAHHLVIDNVSWRVVVEEMVAAHDRARAGLPIQFPAPATSFVGVAHALARLERSRSSDGGAESADAIAALPRDFEGGSNKVASAELVSLRLDSSMTRALLTRAALGARARAEELLLGALAHALTGFAGHDAVLIDVESSARDIETGYDLARTVGWFTAIDPVLMGAEKGSLKHFVRVAKDKLRNVPRHGPGYGRRAPRAEVSFLYLGQLTQKLPGGDWAGLQSASAGLSESPNDERTHVLEARFRVLEESLEASFAFSRALHRRATIEDLAAKVIGSLRALVDIYEADPANAEAEFPDAGLTSAELANIARHLETESTT